MNDHFSFASIAEKENNDNLNKFASPEKTEKINYRNRCSNCGKTGHILSCENLILPKERALIDSFLFLFFFLFFFTAAKQNNKRV